MSVATVVGFEAGYGNISSGLRRCLPIIILEEEKRHFLARSVDWNGESREPDSQLTLIDDDEVWAFGVALPIEERRNIRPGQALLVMGQEFEQDMKDANVPCSDELLFESVPDEPYAICLATVESFERFRRIISQSAAKSFDSSLSSAGSPGLCAKGRAALRVMRQSSYRKSDLAVRELAGAILTHDFDLLRRLKIRYSIELEGESQEDLENKARHHIKLLLDSQEDLGNKAHRHVKLLPDYHQISRAAYLISRTLGTNPNLRPIADQNLELNRRMTTPSSFQFQLPAIRKERYTALVRVIRNESTEIDSQSVDFSAEYWKHSEYMDFVKNTQNLIQNETGKSEAA